MLSNFTKNLFLVFLLGASFSMSAQNINTITINSPSGIAGDYAVVRAAFGSTSNTPITGNAAFASDGTVRPFEGCSEITNTVTGLIGFVDRGTCGFSNKVLNVQIAGAIVAIVCNNVANSMQPPFAMAAGTVGANVTIPTFMVSYADCQKIRADIISGGVNITLRNSCKSSAVYGPTVVWGNVAGQGDFKGGLNDWIVEKENTWDWNSDGNSSKGAYGGVQSCAPSACDGVIEFNADFLDNGGVAGAFGDGPCPSPCSGGIISPVIDLSGVAVVGIVVEYVQSYRHFTNSAYRVLISKDGGQTWPDTNVVNTSAVINGPAIACERVALALIGYEGVQSLRIKFDHVGNYYYWMVDDVIVKNEAITDVQVNTNFYVAAPQLRTPSSQVLPMPVLADISNIGNSGASNVRLTVNITDPADNNSVFSTASLSYGSVAPRETVENRLFPALLELPNKVGSYNGSYSISSTEEATGANNTVGFQFEVTENTYANLLPESVVNPANYMNYSLSPWTIGADQIYYTGANIYHVKDGTNFVADSVRFGLANAFELISETGFVSVDLYEWIDEDGDSQSQPSERIKVGTNAIFLDAVITNIRNVAIPIFGLDADGNADDSKVVPLKSNTSYVVTASAEPLDEGAEQYQFLGYTARTFSAFDRSTNFTPVNFALDSLDSNRNAGSLFGVAGIDGDKDDRNLRSIGNGPSSTTMFLELKIRGTNSTFDVTDKLNISTFPNPATKDLFVDVVLANSADVTVEIVAMDGKKVASKTFSNVKEDRLRMDVSSLANGSYSVLVNTKEGVATRKIVVQK